MTRRNTLIVFAALAMMGCQHQETNGDTPAPSSEPGPAITQQENAQKVPPSEPGIGTAEEKKDANAIKTPALDLNALPTPKPLPADGQNAIWLLSTLSLVVDQGQTPGGLYVKGKMDGGRFVPSGGVMGTRPADEDGTPGWLELSDGKFYPAQTARAPAQPFLEGKMTQSGFVPAAALK